MTDTAPYEVLAGPVDVWIAAVGVAMPEINAAPSGSWTKLGASGSKNISEEGVVISNPQTIEVVRVLGTTAPMKAFRSEEETIIAFTLYDIRPEAASFVLNGNAVTTVGATATVGGYKHVSLYRGNEVTEYALLVRSGKSPYGAGFNLQYEIWRAFINGSPEAAYVKAEPVGLAFEFTALWSEANSSTGRMLAQHLAPTG